MGSLHPARLPFFEQTHILSLSLSLSLTHTHTHTHITHTLTIKSLPLTTLFYRFFLLLLLFLLPLFLLLLLLKDFRIFGPESYLRFNAHICIMRKFLYTDFRTMVVAVVVA